MKNPKDLFEKNRILIKGGYTLNTRNNAAVGSTIICTYSLDEEKGLQ